MKIVFPAILVFATAACTPERAPTPPREVAATTAQRPSKEQSEAYMRKAEADWAQVFVKDNPELFERILADDFVGVFSNGAVLNKADTIKREKPDPSFISARLDYANYRHFGDTVIAQGVESAQRKDGAPDLRLIWTDVWIWRDGKWQMVASHVSRLPEKP